MLNSIATQSFTILALSTTLCSAYFANRTSVGVFELNATLVFDGRMPKNKTTPSTFDSIDTSPYLTDSAYGQNLTWSDVITLPKVSPALFDPNDQEAAIEISLSDESIFQPGIMGFNRDTTNRRADLSPNVSIPYSTPPGYPDVSGHKTVHFSLQNTARSLNYSHSYTLAWMLNQKFSHEQWKLETGDKYNISDPKTLMLSNSNYSSLPIFTTPFTDGWHNFAVVMDFDKNTTQVLYSNGTNPLAEATPVFPNDLSGGGQYHFGLSKNPYGGNGSENYGFQESGINESIIFEGIWMEDTALGPVSLAPGNTTS